MTTDSVKVIQRNPVLDLVSGGSYRSWDESSFDRGSFPVDRIDVREQETVVQISRNEDALVHSSDTTFIRKLAKKPSFRVTRMVLSPKGLILSVDGVLSSRKVSIRS
jgi:hypothetical protein